MEGVYLSGGKGIEVWTSVEENVVNLRCERRAGGSVVARAPLIDRADGKGAGLVGGTDATGHFMHLDRLGGGDAGAGADVGDDKILAHAQCVRLVNDAVAVAINLHHGAVLGGHDVGGAVGEILNGGVDVGADGQHEIRAPT